MSSAKDEAINLLSLDGGGVRGVASLVILHEIMLKVKEVRGLDKIPKPCEFFHMIGGTSTGGLIAIMLGRLRMSTEEALYEYDQCASKVFSTQNKKWTSVTEKFRATALKEIVEDLVRRRNMGEYLEDHTLEYDSKGQCFVCVMPADQVGEPRRLRSFASVGSKDDPGVKIWEAARATTAASFFFKPMALRTGKCLTEDYIDAAIGCNNPAEYLLQEAADQIGTGRRLGCVISIGTGTREVRIGRATSLRQTPTFIKELFGTLKSTATDGEETHRRIQSKFGHYPNAYFRFNVPGVAAEVKLHHYLKMKALKAATTTYLSDSLAAAQVLAAARVLERNASEHGLTLGHIHGIDKDQVVLSTLEAQPLGHISRFFTGRGDVLKKLDTCFAKRDTGGKPRREFLLYGLGGVGKTQIALKAADDLEDRFKYVFHIDGTNTLTAKQSYSSICQEFCQAECPGTGTTDEMKDTALRWLDKLTDEWLMIYDNYAENERFRPILPRSNRGNVIYTSRSQGFLGDLPAACVCEVKPFGKEDAVDLLLKIAGRGEPESDVELQSAQEIVAAVGFLPLAIESAGAYIREGDCSSLSYLKRFRDQGIRPKLLSKPNADGTLPARPALYTALDLSYDAIVSLRRRKGRGLVGRTAECALQALNLLCFYHNEEIPVRIIERAAMERVKWGGHAVYPLSDLADCPFMDPSLLLATNFPEGTWNDFFFDLGLQLLHRLSLVKLTPGRKRVSMHVMVQAWAQDRMSEQARPRQALVARMVLIESIVISWSKFDLTWLRLLPPHMKACLAHEAVPVTHDPYQAQLDHKLGWYYKWEKQFASAIEHFENALRIRKFEKGAHAPAATTVLFQLGQVYYDMGRLNDAEFTYLEIIDRFELRVAEGREKQEERKVRREKKSEKRARRQKTGFPSRARPKGMAEDGQIKDKQDMGDESSSTLDTPVKKGDEDETPYTKSAEQQFEDIMTFTSNRLREEEETLEDLEFELASAYTELANVHYDQGRFKSCRGLMRRAIGLLKRANHPDDIRVWALEDELIRRFAGGGI